MLLGSSVTLRFGVTYNGDFTEPSHEVEVCRGRVLKADLTSSTVR